VSEGTGRAAVSKGKGRLGVAGSPGRRRGRVDLNNIVH
jgi:hypothetical protein